jgi:hypothetical protein
VYTLGTIFNSSVTCTPSSWDYSASTRNPVLDLLALFAAFSGGRPLGEGGGACGCQNFRQNSEKLNCGKASRLVAGWATGKI